MELTHDQVIREIVGNFEHSLRYELAGMKLGENGSAHLGNMLYLAYSGHPNKEAAKKWRNIVYYARELDQTENGTILRCNNGAC